MILSCDKINAIKYAQVVVDMKRLIASMMLFVVSLSIFVPIRYVFKLDERVDMESKCYSIPSVQYIGYIESGLKYKFTPFCDVVFDKKYEKQLREKAKVFAEDLELLCGYYMQAAPGTHPGKGNIFLTLDCDRDDIGEEGYVIEVRKNYIKICGNSEKGVFWGTRTLLQWLNQGYILKEMTVVDYPEYRERSSMIDVARKYFSVEYIMNHIRELSYLKYNYLYLHLTDNEAFRIECESYPEIVSDKHYTKKEIKEIIEFAKRYNITVIPEIEMPGHMASVTKVYPEWQLEDKNGNYNHTRIDLTNPEVYEFVENLLNEFVPMFEGEYFHIGADEYIPIDEYSNYPKLEAYAKEKYGSKAKAIDAYYGFINFANGIVKKHGKTTRIWNDGLGPYGTIKVDTDIVLDVWLTNSKTYSASNLIKMGYTVGNSNTSKLYYVLGVDWASAKPDDIYENFDPYIFVNYEMLKDEPKNVGAKIQLWCDKPDSETEEELYTSLYAIYRALAQKNWGSERIVEYYGQFKKIMNMVGHAPGYTGVKTQIDIYKKIEYISRNYNKGYVEIDLGQIYKIDRVEAGAKIRRVEFSLNATNWSEQNEPARFVRIFADNITEHSDINVFGELLPDNLAFNKKVTVSSAYDEEIWPASHIVDGLRSTRWASVDTARSNGMEWVIVDLEDSYNIDAVCVYWETACPNTYIIELSDDGEVWTKITERKDTKAGLDYITVNGRGRYARITSLDFATPYGISIFELKVFGTN